MKLFAPGRAKSISVAGSSYVVDEDGTADFAPEHVHQAREHGFTDRKSEPPAASPNVTQQANDIVTLFQRIAQLEGTVSNLGSQLAALQALIAGKARAAEPASTKKGASAA